jgi:uncharacterized protein (TIGR02145 family)
MKKNLSLLASFSLLFIVLFLFLMISCKKTSGGGGDVPTILVASVNKITQTSATSGGEVTSDGGSAVTSRGVCWSSDKIPTTSDNKTTDGSGSGTFTSSVIGLNPGATYNIRAYAINASGTAYSIALTFTALSYATVLTTAPFSAITTTTAKSGGDVPNDAGAPVTARGVCWNTSSNPTIGNNKTIDGSGPGAFTSSLTGLTPNTNYYIRAYATTSTATSYGNELVIKTFTGTVKDIDKNVYNTITIGTEVWMAENLKTTIYNDGTPIPMVTDPVAWTALTTDGYCWYSNDSATYKKTYGGLYNFYVVDTTSNGGKNVCPAGWHVPTDYEWSSLTGNVGGDVGAGGKLKEAGTTHWLSPNAGATNESFFSALPGGSRGGYGAFIDIGASGNFWTSDKYYDTTSSWDRFISSDNSNVHRQYIGKVNGLSIRCIKD